MIKVLRVDDRLLHGQVAVAWTNYYKVDTDFPGSDLLREASCGVDKLL